MSLAGSAFKTLIKDYWDKVPEEEHDDIQQFIVDTLKLEVDLKVLNFKKRVRKMFKLVRKYSNSVFGGYDDPPDEHEKYVNCV